MTQPSLLDLPPVRHKVHKRVRDTSRAQARLASDMLTGRKAEVLRWLGSYYDQWDHHPTAAELWRWEYVNMNRPRGIDFTSEVLYIRRGLSDLQSVGLVESAGKRICTFTGRTVETWRVVQR